MTQILRGLGTAAVAVALVGAGAGCHSGGSEPSASSTTGAASASSAANSTAAEPFTGYLEPVGGTKDNITYQVDLPQVRGGDTAVREKFNSSMRTALDDYLEPDESRSTTVAPGALVDDHKSAVTHVGPGSVAGVLIMNIFVERSAHPFNTVSTVVIDAHTAAPIMLSDLFTDPEAGMTKLVDGIKTAMAKDPGWKIRTLRNRSPISWRTGCPAPTAWSSTSRSRTCSATTSPSQCRGPRSPMCWRPGCRRS